MVLSAVVRDLAIIIVAIQTIVISILLGVLIWQIWQLTAMIQNEVKPIVDDTQATVNTVRGTATFLSDNMVHPVVRSSRTLVRWQATLRALARDLQGPPSGGGPV
jgi:hypothetical protein